MRPGDLVLITTPPVSSPQDPRYYLRRHQNKLGLVVSFEAEQVEVDTYYGLWNIMVDGEIVQTQGMHLKVINEDR